MDKIKSNDNVLIIWHKNEESQISKFVEEVKKISQALIALENSERLITSFRSTNFNRIFNLFFKATRPQSTFDVVISNWLPPHGITHTDELLAKVVKLLKPNGFALLKDAEDIQSKLKLNGFVNIETDDAYYKAMKANFEVGSKSSLNLKSQKPAVWKLDDDDISSAWAAAGDTDEVIDSDALLDEEDLKKPEKESLKVCATTGKRKACADCSCGLAEELRGETKEAPKSSCGSCYLGDAFRCATCPYIGMPAFKPGEKVLLADLKPDL